MKHIVSLYNGIIIVIFNFSDLSLFEFYNFVKNLMAREKEKTYIYMDLNK